MKIVHETDQFTLLENSEELGFLRYGIIDDIMYINGVVVEVKHRSKGLAKVLLDAGVDYAKDNKLKIIPRCSYVVSAFDRGGYEDVDAR